MTLHVPQGSTIQGPAGPPGPQGPAGAPGVSGSGTGLPVGAPVAWIGATVPTGWMECAGQTLDAAKTPKLAAIYGAHLPDLRGRVLLGATDARAAGATGGAESVTLTVDQLPAHQHGYLADDQAAGAGVANAGTGARSWDAVSTSGASGFTGLTDATGKGASVPILPPFVAVRWIVEAA